jgi:glutathione S-transferase
MTEPKPILWQIGISHYSEKVRWTLDHKAVDHVRRAPPPGFHIAVALWLTRGAEMTFPVLEMDGRRIGDSTAIVAALEDRYPDRPLYPADPEERRRALALEEFFDEQLGPHARLLPFAYLLKEPDLFAELAAKAIPGPLSAAKAPLGAYARAYTSLRWGANDEEAAVAARAGVIAAMDRLEQELESGDGEFLVGSELSVADVTAASMFGPIVGPDEGPVPPGQQMPADFELFRDSLRERLGFAWVEETFRRHRNPARPVAASAGL